NLCGPLASYSRIIGFTEDGKQLYIRDVSKLEERVRVFEVDTGRELSLPEGVKWDGKHAAVEPEEGVKVSPDGKFRVTFEAKMEKEDFIRELKVWEVQTKQEVLSVKDDVSEVFCFSPDGKRFANCSCRSEHPTVYVWDLPTRKLAFTFRGH